MAGVPDAKDLGKLELFRGLSATELTQVNDLLGRTKFPAGAMILTADQPGEIAYVIVDGTLKVSTIQSNGRELTLALLGPGEMVGELALADRAARSADVTALETSVLVWLDRGTFERLRRDLPAMATLDVHGRVARQLLALADVLGEEVADGGVRIPLRITQSDLAALVGATRVRINEVLVGFTRRRNIAVDRQHRITIRNRGE